MKKEDKTPSIMVDVAEFHNEEQHRVMEQIAKDGVCPFCLTHLAKYHREPILWENRDWLVTNNDYPYDGTGLHLLIICKHHIEKIVDLDATAWTTFGQTTKWIIRRFRLKGGSLLMRFGEMRYNGSSVQHLHAHIIVGKKKGRDTESLKVKVGYRKKRG